MSEPPWNLAPDAPFAEIAPSGSSVMPTFTSDDNHAGANAFERLLELVSVGDGENISI
jgi:hypothetical protein